MKIALSTANEMLFNNYSDQPNTEERIQDLKKRYIIIN